LSGVCTIKVKSVVSTLPGRRARRDCRICACKSGVLLKNDVTDFLWSNCHRMSVVFWSRTLEEVRLSCRSSKVCADQQNKDNKCTAQSTTKYWKLDRRTCHAFSLIFFYVIFQISEPLYFWSSGQKSAKFERQKCVAMLFVGCFLRSLPIRLKLLLKLLRCVFSLTIIGLAPDKFNKHGTLKRQLVECWNGQRNVSLRKMEMKTDNHEMDPQDITHLTSLWWLAKR
jgi:hypothetical protein